MLYKNYLNILPRYWITGYNQNTIERQTTGCIIFFRKKGDLKIAKHYQGLNLTFIVTNIYNALPLNRIQPEFERIFWENQNGFRRKRFTTSQILKTRGILEWVHTKDLEVTLLLIYFSSAFESIHKRKDRANISRVWSA